MNLYRVRHVAQATFPCRLLPVLAIALALSGCLAPGLGDFTSSIGSASLTGAGSTAPRSVTLFVASTRSNDEGSKDGGSVVPAHYAMTIISVPPHHRAGRIEMPTFGRPDARRDFVVAGGRTLSSDRFDGQIATHLSGRVGSDRDILLYIHGFNTSLDEARFRLAQIVTDSRFGGVPVLFTWPAQTSLFSYVSDKERATASRDALEKVMRDLGATPGVGRIHILAHSMGAWLAMESLRENAIAGSPDLGGRLGDVMLAAPDIDLGVFRQQLTRLGGKAKVSVFVSHDDRALGLSSRLAGDRPRLGAMNPSNARDKAELNRLGVKVYDLSSFDDGFIGHGAYADSPDVIRAIGAQLAEPRKDDASTMAVIDAGGAPEATDASAAALPTPAAAPAMSAVPVAPIVAGAPAPSAIPGKVETLPLPQMPAAPPASAAAPN